MREFKSGEDRIVHLPDTSVREQSTASGFFHCECHERMGNDFYFLPMGACLRADKTCSNTGGQSLDGQPH